MRAFLFLLKEPSVSVYFLPAIQLINDSLKPTEHRHQVPRLDKKSVAALSVAKGFEMCHVVFEKPRL